MIADSGQIALGRLRISREAAVVAAATVVFIGVSVWWLLRDRHVSGGDGARHLHIALQAGEMLRAGDLGALFDLGPSGASFYPPLVHVIGGIPSALDLSVQDWGPTALNVVFVPILAAGCYLTGRLVYGATAGMLAAIFALGTPMVLSLFHDFLLDTPLAAMVAISAWALLATDRFSRGPQTAVAGGLVGLAMLVKPAAPLYLLGPALVMLAGGGWRHWRHLALGAAAVLVVAGPYYAVHAEEVLSLSSASTTAGGLASPGTSFEPEYANPRYTADGLTWYAWIGVNNQYFLPFISLLAIGLVFALRELRTRRHAPELLAGLGVGYLAITLLFSIRDPRYTLPLLVFVAIIATGWLAVSSRTLLRRAGVTVLLIAATLNIAATVTDALPTLRLVPPGTEVGIIDRGSLTVLDDRGYTVGQPRPDPLWDDLFSSARDAGVDTLGVNIRESVPWGGSEGLGFEVAGNVYGILATAGDLAQPDLRVTTWWRPETRFAGETPLPRPCGTVPQGIDPATGSDSVPVSVAVERRLPAGGYERWCDF